jgi:hypothetical protein
MRRLHLTLITAAILVTVSACGQSPAAPSAAGSVSAGGLAAKGGGGKPPSLERAVMGDLRCPGPLCGGADRVLSDAAPYAVAIGSDGNLGFALSDSARRVVFDFTDCVEPCAPARRWFTTASVGMPHDLWMHTSVLVPGTDTETPGGLHDVPVGATWASRIKILFRLIDPSGKEIGWAIRFNPFYSGSTNLQVTRVSATEWLLEATALQRAWLQSQTISKRGGDPSFEGNFVLPFQMRIPEQ